MEAHQAQFCRLLFVAADDVEVRVQITEFICKISQYIRICLKRLDNSRLDFWVR
jgi:hypothetical protein